MSLVGTLDPSVQHPVPRFTEWFGLEGTFKGHLVQPSAISRDIFNWIRLLRALSSLTLNVSRDGASTTSLGNLGQCLTTLSVKNFSLLSSVNLPSLCLKPLPLVLSQQALLKSLYIFTVYSCLLCQSLGKLILDPGPPHSWHCTRPGPGP